MSKTKTNQIDLQRMNRRRHKKKVFIFHNNNKKKNLAYFSVFCLSIVAVVCQWRWWCREMNTIFSKRNIRFREMRTLKQIWNLLMVIIRLCVNFTHCKNRIMNDKELNLKKKKNNKKNFYIHTCCVRCLRLRCLYTNNQTRIHATFRTLFSMPYEWCRII